MASDGVGKIGCGGVLALIGAAALPFFVGAQVALKSCGYGGANYCLTDNINSMFSGIGLLIGIIGIVLLVMGVRQYRAIYGRKRNKRG